MSGPWVWLSGRFLPESEASVPVGSRTIRLGVGIYDTFRVRCGEAPLLGRHLARLEAAARGWGLWPAAVDWAGVLAELARRNALADGIARITLGDGFALLALRPLPADLEQQRREGIALRAVALERAAAALKSVSRFDLELAEAEAGGEALLVTADGSALETTRANFFAVTDRGLQTAPLPRVLPGVARSLVLEIAAAEGIPVHEVAPALAGAGSWHEAFATSSPRGLRPVRAIGDVVLRSPCPGALSVRLQRALDAQSGLLP